MFFWSLELGLIQHFKYSCTFSKHCIITIFCNREIIQLNPEKHSLNSKDVTKYVCIKSKVFSYCTMQSACFTVFYFLDVLSHLKRPVIFDGPDTDADGDEGQEHEGDEDQDPGVGLGLKVVTGQELKHQQQQVHPRTDHHRLELNMAVVFHSTTKH